MTNKIGSIDYQWKVLRRLEKQWSISASEKIAWLSGIYIGKVTSILGINIDFVTDKQAWVFNIANKIHESQVSLLWNIAKNVWKDQISIIWINSAEKIKGNQFQWAGYQTSKKIWISQCQFVWWLQKWGEISEIQSQIIWWYQTANQVWKVQFQWIGIQEANYVWEEQTQGIGKEIVYSTQHQIQSMWRKVKKS